VFPFSISEAAPSGGIIMGGIRKTVARKTPPLVVDPNIQAERLRIAEDIARALREAGYECSNDRIAPTLRREN
jgi:hypothetical protein